MIKFFFLFSFFLATLPFAKSNLAFGSNISHLLDAVELAKEYTGKALANPFLNSSNHKLREQIVFLQRALDNEYDFSIEWCRGNKKGLISYTHAALLDPDFEGYSIKKGEKKKNKIYFCRKSLNLSKEVLAQNIIHETSHLSMSASEQSATNLEIVIVFLGGGAPFFNAHTCFKGTCEFTEHVINIRDNLDADFAVHVGTFWLKLPTLADNKINFEMNQLRSAIIFNSEAEVHEFLDMHTDQWKDWRDHEGNTLAMIAAREGRVKILELLINQHPFQSLIDRRNNRGDDLYGIARRYDRKNILSLFEKHNSH